MAEATLVILIVALLLLVFISLRLVKDSLDATRLAAELENEKKNSAEKLELLQQSEARLKTEFENLANKIFTEKGLLLTEQNRERLTSLLQPFKEQLESFRKRVDEVHTAGVEQTAKLVEQVRQIQDLSNKVSGEANNLARAIKGEAKTQGDWGEVIVERIFEASGLERGREYECQVSIQGEEGTKRPDFMVYLPGDRAVIVDAKVSLTAYERCCNEQEEEQRKVALEEHIESVRKHVKELRDQDYQNLLGNRTLDFVIMCIPIEPAYQAALRADGSLIYDLAKTNVVITGPTTLMITLRLISQIWRREHENRYAEMIADRAGKLYDQVKLVYDAMADAKKQLTGVADKFDLALARLKGGRGNLVGRVEELRSLGAKVSKQLPAEIVEQATAADEETDGTSS